MRTLPLVAASLVACATTGRWPPDAPGEEASRKIAQEWIGRNVNVEPRPQSPEAQTDAQRAGVSATEKVAAEKVLLRNQTLHLLELDTAAIHGETADGLLTIPLSEVQSISYRKRLGTAIGGGLLGLVLGTLVGSAAASSGTNCGRDSFGGTCLVVPIVGAATGLIVGATVGAMLGSKNSLIVEPPIDRRSPDAMGR